MDNNREDREARHEAAVWRVVLLSAGGAQLLPGQRLQLNGFPVEPGPADVVLYSRYEDVGVSDPIPRELAYEVQVPAEDADAAIAIAGAVGSGLATMLSFAVNAYVPAPEPYVAFEGLPGLNRRRFWQRHVTFVDGIPRPGRLLKEATLFPMLQAMFGSGEWERLSRAVSQYHAALSHWTVSAKPLALAHLYMALEALAPVVERSERARLEIPSQREHADHRGVDVERSNWKEVLLGWVRRDVICKGDKATYDAARKASDGFEHGSMPLPEFRSAAELYGRPLIDYLREGLLGELRLADELHQELIDKRPLDVSPMWLEVRGELHGNVEDPDELGEGGARFPYVDWHTTLADVRRREDGRLRITPVNHLTLHCAEGVNLTPTQHALKVGLSDADLFDYEPPETEPLTERGDADTGDDTAAAT